MKKEKELTANPTLVAIEELQLHDLQNMLAKGDAKKTNMSTKKKNDTKFTHQQSMYRRRLAPPDMTKRQS